MGISSSSASGSVSRASSSSKTGGDSSSNKHKHFSSLRSVKRDSNSNYIDKRPSVSEDKITKLVQQTDEVNPISTDMKFCTKKEECLNLGPVAKPAAPTDLRASHLTRMSSHFAVDIRPDLVQWSYDTLKLSPTFVASKDWDFLPPIEDYLKAFPNAHSIISNEIKAKRAQTSVGETGRKGEGKELDEGKGKQTPDWTVSEILTDNELFALSLSLPSFAEAIHSKPAKLFGLESLSFTRFVSGAEFYESPVFIVMELGRDIHDTQTYKVCVYVNGGLSATGSSFGGDELIAIASMYPSCFHHGSGGSSAAAVTPPRIEVRTAKADTNYYRLNPVSKFAPLGLSFGGDDDTPRLLIHSDLTHVTLGLSDATFGFCEFVDMSHEDSDGTSRTMYIKKLEVWGFGDEEVLRNQSQKAAALEMMREDRRKVDLAAMFGDDQCFLKKNQAGERQGEVESIVEEFREQNRQKKQARW